MKIVVRVFVLLALGYGVVSAQPVAQPSGRLGLALVIGNSQYADGELATVKQDHASMTKALSSLGFKVREVENLKYPQSFDEELDSFLKKEDAEPDDVLVVYYSGHGIQIDGDAYLLATGFTETERKSGSLRGFAKSVDSIISRMENAAPAYRVLIVDACRNNAYGAPSSLRKSSVRLVAGLGDTYVLFADEPGKTVPAFTSSTLQSPFTASLLYSFENVEGGIEKRFGVAAAKTTELSHDQRPQMLSSKRAPGRPDREFIDTGSRQSAGSESVKRLLAQASVFYRDRIWDKLKGAITAAKVISPDSETVLKAQLDRELDFIRLVSDAQSAEQSNVTNADWAKTAGLWEKAGSLFPTRVWVLERSYLCWLLADRTTEAVQVLARIQSTNDSTLAARAKTVLQGLLVAEPALEAVAKSSAATGPMPSGPEFEYAQGQEKAK